MSKFQYRPDIDGLRSIAILAVLGFHAFPTYVPGGFVGVDVFFVISGFLISTIIFRELEKGDFSLIRFYKRRIRRIFPALILLTLACWLFGWYVLLPDEFEQLGKHIAGGNGFISNILLWGESGYFDNSSETKPLLHLWSLGIEEQFYFLWPLSLALVWRSWRSVLVLTLFVAVSSFVANIYALKAYTAATVFYLPVYRFWELMIGGMLAYMVLRNTNRSAIPTWLATILSMVGAALIGVAVVRLDKDSPFPGWLALLPTVGTFMLIAARRSVLNRWVLGSPPLVYIGLISYPLYLWHWTIISFCHILGFTSPIQMTMALAASFVLAVLTYELVEKQLKKLKSGRVVYALSLGSLLVLLLGVGTYYGHLSPRNDSRGIKLAMEAVGDWSYPEGLTRTTLDGLRAYVKEGAPETVLFYGDSHMEQYAPRIVKLIDEDPANTKSAVFITSSGCPPIPNVLEDKHSGCNLEFKRKVLEYALSPKIDTVVIAASWDYLLDGNKPAPGAYRYYYLSGEEKVYFDEGGNKLAIKAFEDMLAMIAKQKPVYLVIDNPNGRAFDPKAHFSGTRLSGYVDNDKHFQKYSEGQAYLRDLMLAMATRVGAEVIDTVSHFCENGDCLTKLPDETPIYKDGGHIRPFYVRDYLDIFDVTVRK